MVEKPLVSPSVPTHPICGHEGTLWLMMQGRRPRTISSRASGRTGQPEGEQHRRTTDTAPDEETNKKTEATGEERPGQAEGDRQGD